MTHIQNVDSFTQVVEFCSGFGGVYNPGQTNLQLPALRKQLEEVRMQIELMKVAKAQLDWLVNERRYVFDQLPRLAARIMRTLEASRASAEMLADARQYVRELVGKPKSRPAEQPASHPHSQLAFASKVDTFIKLIEALQREPLYKPNEPYLQVNNLMAHANGLQQMNNRVDQARTTYRFAIIKRNHLLYLDFYSVSNTLWAVKKYLRAVFGWGSPEYNLVRKYEIVKPTLRK